MNKKECKIHGALDQGHILVHLGPLMFCFMVHMNSSSLDFFIIN